jgi:hypothetical protein
MAGVIKVIDGPSEALTKNLRRNNGICVVRIHITLEIHVLLFLVTFSFFVSK